MLVGSCLFWVLYLCMGSFGWFWWLFFAFVVCLFGVLCVFVLLGFVCGMFFGFLCSLLKSGLGFLSGQ